MEDSSHPARRPAGDEDAISCAACGKRVHVAPCQRGRKRYCSRACQWAGHERLQKTCAWCQAAFNVVHSKGARSRYCSSACQLLGVARENRERARIHRACPICGMQFITTGGHGGRKACSRLCANQLRAQAAEGRDSKIDRTCLHCGRAFRAFPSRPGHFCSRPCNQAVGRARLAAARAAKGNARAVACAWCGRERMKPRCRAERSGRHFCNNVCYHAWDKLRKNSPEMVEQQRERSLHMAFPNPSGIEMAVAAWMAAHGIRYEPQAVLGRFARLDFRIGDAYVEVNGCYWHGCPAHCKSLSDRQQRRQRKDRAVATYCAKRGIRLFVIWEHDVRAGRFSALYPLLPEGRVISEEPPETP